MNALLRAVVGVFLSPTALAYSLHLWQKGELTSGESEARALSTQEVCPAHTISGTFHHLCRRPP